MPVSKKDSSNNKIEYSYPNHIEVIMIGANILQVKDKNTGTPINLIPFGDIASNNAVIEATMGGVFNFFYLPSDKTYLIEAFKYADISGTKIFISVPNGDGTLERLNYENVQTGGTDETGISFIVGKGNTDKTIKRTLKGSAASAYPPDYSGILPIQITSPDNFQANFQNGVAV